MLFRGRDRIPIVSNSNRPIDRLLRPVASERTTPLWIAGWLDQRIPVILCDELDAATSESFSVNGEALGDLGRRAAFRFSLELPELNESDFDLILTGFDPGEIDRLLAIPDEERATAQPPLQTITLQ